MKMSTTRAALVLLVLFGLAALAPAQQQITAAPADSILSINRRFVSSTTTKNQIPRADVAAGKLAATWKAFKEGSVTTYAEALENSGGWSGEVRLGTGGNGAYHTSAVAISPTDGRARVVWADESQGGAGQIFFSRQQSNGVWTSPVRISTFSTFAHYPQIAIDSRGWIWTIWAVGGGNPDLVRYRVSADDGATWSAEGQLGSDSNFRLWIAADNNNGVHTVWSGGAITYGYSTGGAFTQEIIPSGGFNIDPTVTVDKFGIVHVAWRRLRGESTWDIFYAFKPVGAPSNSWTIQKLYQGGNINYAVPIFADNQGVIHLAWMEPSNTTSDIHYTYKKPNQGWSAVLNATNDPMLQFHVDTVGLTDSSSARGHIFAESWAGGEEDARIEQVTIASEPIAPPVPTATPVPTVQPVNATPRIENNAHFTRKTGALNISFSGITGNPDQVRWRWDALPSNANPWTAFSNPLSISGPAGLSSESCAARALFTQVRNSGNGQLESPPKNDSIVFDIGMQAGAFIQKASAAGAPQTTESDWIRTPAFKYRASQETAGCSGVAQYRAPGTNDSLHNGAPSTSHTVQIDTSGWLAEGSGYIEQDIVATVTITDAVGNSGSVNRTLHYDDDPPVALLDLLPPTIDNDGGSNALATVNVSLQMVSDDSYGVAISQPTKAYWGLWVLVSNSDLGLDPSPQAFIDGNAQVARVVPGTGRAKISLISSDSDPGRTPGPRFVYIRFLDGAGNYSAEVLRGTAVLAEGYHAPIQQLPIVQR